MFWCERTTQVSSWSYYNHIRLSTLYGCLPILISSRLLSAIYTFHSNIEMTLSKVLAVAETDRLSQKKQLLLGTRYRKQWTPVFCQEILRPLSEYCGQHVWDLYPLKNLYSIYWHWSWIWMNLSVMSLWKLLILLWVSHWSAIHLPQPLWWANRF